MTFGQHDTDRETLAAAFDLVCNKNDWKAPIDCIVKIPEASVKETISDAIEFFTATVAKWELIGGDPHGPIATRGLWWRVRAEGYRRGPAGDC